MRTFLEKPYVIFLGMIAGAMVGYFFPAVGTLCKPFGKVYLSMLSMCILPIIMLAIFTGMGKMLRSPSTRSRFVRLFILLGCGLFIPSLVGILAAALGGPGKHLGASTIQQLGTIMNDVEVSEIGAGSMVTLLNELVPSNIFTAMSNGKVLGVVFFCTLLGIALGIKQNENTDHNLKVAEGSFDLFTLVFKWALVPLPLGLFCTMASEISQLDIRLLLVLVKYTLVFLAAVLLILLQINALIAYVTKTSFFTPFKACKNALMLSLVTNSSFVALVPASEGLNRLKVNREIVSVFMPFGLAANRHGKIFFFAFTSIFIAQLYDVDLSATGYITCLAGSALVGMAAVGDGLILAPSLAIVLDIMHLPTEIGFVILVTISPVLSRFLSVITIYANCALVALVAKGVKSA